MTPKISIIVPVYNTEQYLRKCIESILNQTFTEFEVLLINDGSTDGSGEICNEYAQKDTRVKVFHKVNGGVSSARNVGLNNAVGEYISFVDSDDELKNIAYQGLIEKVIINRSQICVGTKIQSNGQIISRTTINKSVLTGHQALIALLKNNFPTSLWLCLYKKTVLDTIRLNEDIYFWEDFEFQARALSYTERVSIYNIPFYIYNRRAGSANHQVLDIKILSCLLIPDLLKTFFQKKKELNSLTKNLYAYFAFQCIAYSLKSITVQPQFYHMITAFIRKNKYIIFTSSYFVYLSSFRIKIAIISSFINTNYFYYIYKFFIKKSLTKMY